MNSPNGPQMFKIPSELMCDITQVVCAKTRTTASDGLFGGYQPETWDFNHVIEWIPYPVIPKPSWASASKDSLRIIEPIIKLNVCDCF